jgi:hypothetical protein
MIPSPAQSNCPDNFSFIHLPLFAPLSLLPTVCFLVSLHPKKKKEDLSNDLLEPLPGPLGRDLRRLLEPNNRTDQDRIMHGILLDL